jgi:ribonucleoside-diphosphate reductase beta chain
MLFNKKDFDATKEPMFFGENVNVSRYDQQKYPVFENLIDKQLSFFWRPTEVDITQDRKDFNEKLSDHERHIFTANLKYQTLLDSVQGRGPNLCLLPIVSLPEVETWIETWCFEETIHSRSYTHILRNLIPDPSEFFDNIVTNEWISARAESVCHYGDDLKIKADLYNALGFGTYETKDFGTVEVSMKSLKKALYLYLMSVNVLEAIRFYVSFACSFAFAERSLMEGNAKIIKFIARSEALHLVSTQHMINILRSGRDDPEMAEIAKECEEESIRIFTDAAQQEKDWAEYLFKDGSMIGLNKQILSQYVEYITNIRLQGVGLKPQFETRSNPIPWINAWLVSDNVQVAPQEAELSSYLTGQIDATLEENDFDDYGDL